MTVSNWVQVVLLVVAVGFVVHALFVPAAYGGDAGIIDALDLLGSFVIAGVIFWLWSSGFWLG